MLQKKRKKKRREKKNPPCQCSVRYLCVFAAPKQHGHVCEEADQVEGHRGHVLGVQHVWIVPASRVAQDVAGLGAVTSALR